jgi:hypothetical protein
MEPATQMNANIGTQILLEGAQELLGAENFHRAVASLPSQRTAWPDPKVKEPLSETAPFIPPEEAGAFLEELEQIYGVPGSKGLALRIGRASFGYGLDRLGDRLGLRAMEFRLLPAPRRMRIGLDILARAIGEICGCQVSVSDSGSGWLWRIEGGPFHGGEQGNQPMCYVVVGLLQEFMTWAGGGRFYRISEIETAALSGSGCIFQIDKKPLD